MSEKHYILRIKENLFYKTGHLKREQKTRPEAFWVGSRINSLILKDKQQISIRKT